MSVKLLCKDICTHPASTALSKDSSYYGFTTWIPFIKKKLGCLPTTFPDSTKVGALCTEYDDLKKIHTHVVSFESTTSPSTHSSKIRKCFFFFFLINSKIRKCFLRQSPLVTSCHINLKSSAIILTEKQDNFQFILFFINTFKSFSITVLEYTATCLTIT